MKLKTLRTILEHPLNRNNRYQALVRFIKRALIVRLTDNSIVYPFIGDSKLVVKKGMASAELQCYTGLYELSEMSFILHFLRKDDLFVDVGANVGVYVILGSKVIGSRTFAFEPIPKTCDVLKENVAINGINDKVKVFNFGVGEREGNLLFTNEVYDSVNHVMVDGEKSDSTIEVQVVSLDFILREESPALIKIDVEGFETMVINGAKETLRKESLKGIIIELNGLANQYGFDEMKIHESILEVGFKPFEYSPKNRTLEESEGIGKQNTLYIRDIDFVRDRINSAPKFEVLGSKL